MDPKCALCKPKFCHDGITEDKKLPDFCPMKNFKDLVQNVKQRYEKEEIKSFFVKAALTEKEAYQEKAAREFSKGALLCTGAKGPNGGNIILINPVNLPISMQAIEEGEEVNLCDGVPTKATKIVLERPIISNNSAR